MDKNVNLFQRHGVYTRVEMESRGEILAEEYAKTLHIEALTMLDMLKKQIIPACVAYSRELADTVAVKKSIGVDAPAELALVKALTEKVAALLERQAVLEEKVSAAPQGTKEAPRYYHDEVIPAMAGARAVADELEMMVGEKHWPFPTYAKILYYV